MLETELTRLLQLRRPIVLAPMGGGPTTPELVGAVTEAGGLGMFAATGLPPDALRDAIAAIRAQTDGPFGVNWLIAPPGSSGDIETVQAALDPLRAELGLPPGPRELTLPPSALPDQIEVALSAGVRVMSFALGDPSAFVEPAHESGALVSAMVTTVDEAVRMAHAGVDFVVAQGAEAGGHRSTFELGPGLEPALVGTIALVPQVVDAVPVPVVASGGIVDGRGLAAALALGAAGAQLGTRFLLAREAGTAPAYRAALVRAVETDTVVTTRLTGRPARSIRNRFLDRLSDVEPLSWPLQRFAAEDIYAAGFARGDAELIPLLAGQGLRGLRDGQPAAEIVDEIAEQAEAVLRALASPSSPSS